MFILSISKILSLLHTTLNTIRLLLYYVLISIGFHKVQIKFEGIVYID